MNSIFRTRINVALAVLAGLGLRVFFVLRFPATDSGDAPFYIELAWNWLKKGTYGFVINGHLTPVDMRVPGYPAFLAMIFAFAGKSSRAVMLGQVVVDLITCFLIALIAARLAPKPSRRRVAIAGLCLAALCPFTANYTAVVLTESLVIFLTALALLILLETDLVQGEPDASPKTPPNWTLSPWFLAGIIVGFGTLVRPETPLVLLAAGLVLLMKWRRPADWTKLARAGVLMGLGLVLPLAPWAARNWHTLHEVQFLAPRYSELPGEYTPHGFNDWTNTWLWRFGDVYTTQWNVEVAEIPIDQLPASAFDSPQERARVADILEDYNTSLTIGPMLDDEFRQIAHERTARHPLRTYVQIPFLRTLTMSWLISQYFAVAAAHTAAFRKLRHCPTSSCHARKGGLALTERQGVFLVATNLLVLILWRQCRTGWRYIFYFRNVSFQELYIIVGNRNEPGQIRRDAPLAGR